MSTIEKPVRQARRRLWLNRWFSALGWHLAAAAGLFALLVAAQRLSLHVDDPSALFLGGLSVLIALALSGSLAWATFQRDSLVMAAAQLDQAAGLKERFSSGLYFQASKDPFAQAVVADAETMASRVNVPAHLKLRMPDSVNYAGATFLVALLVFWLCPTVDLSGKQAEREKDKDRTARVERAQAIIKPLVDEQLKRIKEKNPSLKKDIDDLQPLQDARLDTPLDVRSQAIKQIEQLKDKIEQQRNQADAAGLNDFKKMLRPLAAQKSDTPVGKLADNLAKGDFKAAQEALEALKMELAKTPVTPEEKRQAEELKKQLDQLSDKLKQAAEEQKAARDQLAKAGLKQEDIKRALEKMSRNDLDQLKKDLAEKGLSDQQISKIMQQLQQQQAAGKMMKQLGEKMAQAGQKQDGNGQLSQSGAQGLSEAGEQLSELEALQQQLDQLGSSIAELKDLQKQLGKGCRACDGTGEKDGKPCGACQGHGQGGDPEMKGSGMGELGQGMGGIAPEEQTETRTVMKRTPIKTTPGRIISQEWIDGEQFKGEVSSEFTEAAIAADREITDAIAKEKIPRAYHDGIKEYFTRYKAALPEQPPKPAPDNPSQ